MSFSAVSAALEHMCVRFLRSSALLLNHGQTRKALDLANQASMLQATALLHHLSGNFRMALEAVLADASKADGPFEYISTSLQELEGKLDSIQEMRKSILGCMEDLVARNPEAAALMVVTSFPNDHQAVIQGLQGTRPLLFKYMRSAMQAALSEVHKRVSIYCPKLSNRPTLDVLRFDCGRC